jgi:hypothetical protein
MQQLKNLAALVPQQQQSMGHGGMLCMEGHGMHATAGSHWTTNTLQCFA